MDSILFLNVAHMKWYSGRTDHDVPVGGGEYRDEDKEEVNNFNPLDGYMYGYVAAGRHRSINITRLGSTDNSDSIDGIDVVWTAPTPNRGRIVVGWYRNATVYRHLQEYERGYYHVRAIKENCRLLPTDKRTLRIGDARSQPGGFGRNVWFAEKHYGARVRRSVKRLMRQAEHSVFDRGELNDRTAALEPLNQPPRGVRKPWRDTREVALVGRDPEVQKWILQCADGRCELCDEPAPFAKQNGHPYLEIHHIHRLADGGADTPENAVALCPNCHREAHYGTERKEIRERLRQRVFLRTNGPANSN